MPNSLLAAFDNTAPALNTVAAITAFDNTAPVNNAADDFGQLRIHARLVVTGNIVITSTAATTVIDGVTTAINDVILLVAQTLPAANGLYVQGASALTRDTRMNEAAELNAGVTVAIDAGTAGQGKLYQLTTPAPIVVGTTELTFSDQKAAPIA